MTTTRIVEAVDVFELPNTQVEPCEAEFAPVPFEDVTARARELPPNLHWDDVEPDE